MEDLTAQSASGTHLGRLLVFFDFPYSRGADGVYCQDSFWIFLQTLGERFDGMAVLGRVQAEEEAPCYRCAPGEKIAFYAPS